MKRCIPLLLLVLATASLPAAPVEDTRESQVLAATAGALLRLEDDINHEKLGPRLTVEQFLQRTGQTSALIDLLRRADQIGGPRWIDDQTCQVKLSIPGQRVEKMLEQIAADLGPKSPLPAAAIRIKLRDWSGRTFLATGTSTSAANVASLRPKDSTAWQQVDDTTRRRALTDAAQDAARRALDSIRSLPIAPGKSGDALLSDKSVAERFNQWLTSRPITNVRFHDDLSIELTLGVTSDQVFDALTNAAGVSPKVSLIDTGPQLDALRRDFETQFAPPVGRSRVDNPTTAPAARTRSLLPDQAPDWVRNPIRTQAQASNHGSKLKTARAAEAKAMENLRAQIDTLPLGGNMTLAEAAKQSARIAQAVNSAVSRARIVKVDYLADGQASVKLEFDPRDLWDQLSQLP
jgi:hypothetical protein